MHLASLTLTDFRNLAGVELAPDPEGTTVLTGPNGVGKTSVLEAVGYLATLRSFRGVPREALVRRGAERAYVRAATVVGERELTVEAEIAATGRSRTLVNRQAVRRRSDLQPALHVSLFSPEDIGVVRGGPAERRRFLDDALSTVDPKVARQIDEVERVLRQRAALLRGSRRRLSPEVAATLDVWDARLDVAGSEVVDAREELVDRLAPLAGVHYSRLAGRPTEVGLAYRRSWDGRLLDALAADRTRDLERGTTSSGPHRDELEATVDGLPSRSHASQGEQRSLALALALAAHQLAAERLGTAPVLLLDDVFSELDADRSRALLAGLPAGQTLLTTALAVPVEMTVAKVYGITGDGRMVEEAGERR